MVASPARAQTLRTMCPMNCHPTYCGMLVTVEDGRLLKIAGDPDHPDSRGFLCVRGRSAHEIQGNPLRLSHPLLRRGPRGSEGWEPISWDDAMDRILSAMRAAGLPRVGVWTGHGSSVSGIGSQLARRFGYLSGVQGWNSSIVCWALGGYGLLLTGTTSTNTKEDMAAHAETVIMWGANVASQPTTAPHLIAARERGATVVAIDVRRTETARHADRMLVIKPGTDAALALGMMQIIVEEGLEDRAFLAEHTVGWERLAPTLGRHTPAWTAAITGLDEDTIRWLARRYATSKPACIVLGGASIFKHRGGWQVSRAISCLPALTGQYGIPGGGLGPRHRGGTHGEGPADITMPHLRPPGEYIPSHMPSMARAMREGKIDVLLLLGTNVLSSFADSDGMAEAIDRVGLVVSHDLFHTETTRRLADIVLPGTSWLEEVGMKDTATHIYLTDQALPTYAEARSTARFITDLAHGIDRPDIVPWDGPEGPVNALLAGLDGGQLTVERLRASDGRYERKISHIAYPDHRYHTPSGKIELYSERAARIGLPPLPIYEPPSETPETAPALADRYPLVFKQGRTFTSFHGFYDEARALPSLAKVNPGPELWISPLDAAERGITHGSAIQLYNDRGAADATARVTEDVPPGVVWMRDGWVAVNKLTSNEDCLSPAQSEALPILGGQATYEALVEVVSSQSSVVTAHPPDNR
ncbi:MAG: molybdopterin-dependent oxidoreductase [Chloroflexi bacterium]|nr:molybdopterin-dependent oxidoreductase [Chloroflexota bacterium]